MLSREEYDNNQLDVAVLPLMEKLSRVNLKRINETHAKQKIARLSLKVKY